MELHRQMNPDWRFSDAATFLLGEIASIESWRRYMEVLSRFRSPDEVPPMFRPQEYGPARTGDPAQKRKPDDLEQARRVKAELLAELVA